MEFKKPKNYNKKLKDFIKEIISKLQSNEAIIDKISESELWEIAFTHESYNPNPGENYEVLEKIGDAAMKLAFSEYLFNRIEMISESDIGEYQIHYLSKVEQSKVSTRLGFAEFILTPLSKTIHIFEDVLEAFFGALLILGNETKPGLGYILCYNMIILIFQDLDIQDEGKFKVSKTELKELLEASGIKELDEEWVKDETGPSGTIKVGFMQKDYDELRAADIKLPERFLATVYESTKKIARIKASEIFYNKIIKLVDTKEWQNFVKLKKKNNEEVNILLNEAKNVGRRVGYSDLYIKISDTGKKGTYVQLVGRRSDNDRLEILGLASDNKVKLMRMQLLQDFINKNK